MADFEFKDNSLQIKAEINEVLVAFLIEAAGEIVSQTQRNSRVDTGQTKGSYEYVVSRDELKATIGSPLENAIWEEFGTGEYALNGDGRKTAWYYCDEKGNWHFTNGKKPNRPLYKASEKVKPNLQKALENKMKGVGGND